MKALLVFVVIAICNEAVGLRDFTNGPMKAEALRILNLSPEGAYSEAQKMSSRTREELLDYLKNEMRMDMDSGQNGPNFDRWHYEGALIGLGDEDMMKEHVRRAEFGILRFIPNPHILELAGPEMFRADLRWVSVKGVPRQSHAARAMSCVNNQLRLMPQVPAHVKNWLDTFSSLILSPREGQRIYCDWWIENADAWRRRDFAALKSGPDMSHRHYSKLTQAEQVRILTADDSGNPTPPLPTPPPIPLLKTNTEPAGQIPTIQKPTPAASEFMRKETGMLLPAVILFGLGIGAWFIFNKRK